MENPPSFWFVIIPEIVYELGRPKSKVRKDERTAGCVTISKREAEDLKIRPRLFGMEDRGQRVYEYAVDFRRQLKARLLKDRIVTQIVRETTLAPQRFMTEGGVPLRRVEHPSIVAWKLATGAYYKGGGNLGSSLMCATVFATSASSISAAISQVMSGTPVAPPKCFSPMEKA